MNLTCILLSPAWILALAACGDVDPTPELELERAAAAPEGTVAVELVPDATSSPRRAELSASAAEASPEPPAVPRLSAQLAVTAREARSRHAAGMRVVVGLSSHHGRTSREVPGSERELVLDARGRALVELEDRLPEDADRDRYGIWARVVEPGWCETRVERSFRRDGDSLPELRLETWRGATLRGVLRDPDGNFVGRGELGLLDDAGALIRKARTTTRTDGRFELHVPQSGRYTVVARRDKVGTARVESLELDVSALPQDFPLTLRGEGVIAGRLVDPAGRPVVGYRIRARPAHTTAMGSLEAVAGDGLQGSEDTVGEDGGFRLSGLRPGDYRLFGRRGYSDRDETDLLGRPVATGGEPLALSVEQHVVTVRVLDPEGAPLEFRPGSSSRDDDGGLTVRVSSVEPGADRPAWSGSTVPVARDLRVMPDVLYRVEAWGLDRGGASAEVSVTDAAPFVALDLHVGPAKEPGRLVVAPRDPDGGVERGWSVSITPVGSRMRVRKLDAEGVGDSVETSLAPGRYLVSVLPAWREFLSWKASAGVPRGPLRSVEREVSVLPREETRIEPRFGGSGWVRVLVELGAPCSEVAPRATVTAAFEGRDGAVEPLGFANGARPEASEAQKASVVDTSHGRIDQRGGIIPGLAQRSFDDLEEGRWRFRAELEGYAPAETVLDVRRDDEVSVRLVLEPSDG